MKTLLIAITLTLPLAGCGVVERMVGRTLPPQAQAQLDDYQESLGHWSESIGRVESEVEVLAKRAAQQAKALNFSAAQSTMLALAEKQQTHKGLTEQYERIAKQERELVEHHFGNATGGVLSLLGTLIPVPFQPLIPVASSLAVMLFSKRARKHTVMSLRHTLAGNLGEAARGLLRAVGAKHSSNDPAVILGGAIKEAKAAVISGDLPAEHLAALETAEEAMV